MIKTGRAINIQLGAGDSTLPNLLGGTFGAGGDVVTSLAGGFGARFFRNAKDKILQGAVSGSGSGGHGTTGGGTGGNDCVHIDTLLPCGRHAGDIRPGDELVLDDFETGIVSYSERKREPLFRIVTAGGVTLVCSASAPIPVRRGGYETPGRLIGHQVRTMFADVVDWDVVMDVQALGEGEVQHITVGNRCFWAGEREGLYLLHHNAKRLPNEPGSDRDHG